jgi:nitrogen fixation protein FixH
MSSDADTPRQGRELTGWHVLAMFVGGSASSSA